jgi:hypothetical protein
MKKQFAITTLVLFCAVLVLDSCKKGENDPFLSLRSRKGRMAGEWKGSKGDGKYVDGSSNTTYTYTWDGTTMNTTITIGSSTFTSSNGHTVSLKIEKDGTYEIITTETFTNNTVVTTDKGVWNFTGKVGEYKNKDHVVFRTLSSTTTNSNPSSTSTTTYTGDSAPSEIWYIDMLKNKEMVVKSKGTEVNASGTESLEMNMTFVQ